MGEIDDAHDPKDERHSQGDEGVKAAHQNTRNNRLNEYKDIHDQLSNDFRLLIRPEG
jgi:hypothetical protein